MSEIKVSAELVSSRSSEGKTSVPCLSPTFWWWPAVLGIPCLRDPDLCLHLHMAFSVHVRNFLQNKKLEDMIQNPEVGME